MSRYIDADALKKDLSENYTFYGFRQLLNDFYEALDSAPSIDIVRCKECKHRIVNEHYGEKGYMKLKAICELDTGDIFQLGRHAEDDDWYCADGEREGER